MVFASTFQNAVMGITIASITATNKTAVSIFFLSTLSVKLNIYVPDIKADGTTEAIPA